MQNTNTTFIWQRKSQKAKRDTHVFSKETFGKPLEMVRGEREEDKEGKCMFTFNFVVHKKMKLATTNKSIK